MSLIETLASEATRFTIVLVMMAGLYIAIARNNLIKKLVGLSLFQSSVYLLYLLPGKIFGGTAPILDARFTIYANPLPHVLILTAIVVGIGTLALGLTLVIRINEAYGTIEEDEIIALDHPGSSGGGKPDGGKPGGTKAGGTKTGGSKTGRDTPARRAA